MFGDDFLAARFCGARGRWCWSYWSGHNAVLASSVGCRRVYDAALFAASSGKAEQINLDAKMDGKPEFQELILKEQLDTSSDPVPPVFVCPPDSLF